MKFNKWTTGLAALGVVSVASVVQAQSAGTESTANTVLTAASSTTLSGYVDTSAHWNPGTGNANVPLYGFNSPSKADGFNLDAVKLSLEKPLDETEWAAGYKVDLMFGPDANLLGATSIVGSSSDLAIRQAYVTLRTPVGNGIDWKIGVFDTVVGYESIDAVSNPNYTRSWGFTLEPTTHTGVLASYKINDEVNVAAGVADTTGPTINARSNPPRAESYKTYMGSVALTAPDSWSFLAGSTLYAGFVNGFSPTAVADQINLYVGTTLATPVTGLRLGLSYDYYGVPAQAVQPDSTWADALGAYASYQATEKLSFHARGEFVWQDRTGANVGPLPASTLIEFTEDVQYDLWKNVMSRLEFRWDRAVDGTSPFGGTTGNPPSEHNAIMFAANLIYKF